MATIIGREQLLEVGAHFGHQSRRWNPKMKSYIFGIKNGVHIIDLSQTIAALQNVCNFITTITKDGGKILFCGTKKQAVQSIKDCALKTQSPFVNQRWLGGTLTNFKTMQKSIKHLWELERDEKAGKYTTLTKKEQSIKQKEREKAEKFFGGIKYMRNLPKAIFVVDGNINRTAILEANKLKIPVIAICDTNTDPDGIDYIIPANDDAAKTIAFILDLFANTIIEATEKIEPIKAKANNPEKDLKVENKIVENSKKNVSKTDQKGDK